MNRKSPRISIDALQEVRGARVSVIGGARSGVAVAQLLLSKGATVFVSDNGAPESLKKFLPELESVKSNGGAYEVGLHSERVFDADLIVVSPGVPTDSAVIRQAERREIRVISEVELGSWFCPAPIVAITGTNGKTTTTSLTGRLFHDAKRNHVVAGNIGNAFSGVVGDLNPDSVAVLEVSSFQLDHIEAFRPKVSVLLNITPDHLDRYGGIFARYIGSKCRIFENQTPDDILIYNFDDEETRENVRRLASLHVRTIPFAFNRQFDEGAFVDEGTLKTVIHGISSEIIDTSQISIPGIHNVYNSMAASLAAQVMNVPIPSIRATLKNFKGVEHRLEFVRELRGVTYINDSKATNVASVAYALRAFDKPIVLLLGGRDKGNDYSQVSDLVANGVRAIVAIGESADTVVREFVSVTNVVKAASMAEAVELAASLAKDGDIVLLSPACASFDWFENYEHRGKTFKQEVNAL